MRRMRRAAPSLTPGSRPRVRAAAVPAPDRFHLLLVAMATIVALALLMLAWTGVARAAAYDDQELAFLRQLNEYRVANGRLPLLLSDQLSLSAERHSHDMGTYHYFSHESEASDYYPVGSEFWDRLEHDGYDSAPGSAENLAAGAATASEVMGLWKGSEGHKANMLDPLMNGSRVVFREVGIARVYAAGSPYGWYWAVEFGSTVDSTARDPLVSGAGSGPFPDVSASHPYAEAIRRLSEDGVIAGYDDGTFGPGRPVWRQHFAKMIVKLLDLPVVESDTSPFTDLSDDDPNDLYPNEYIAVASAQGITQGMTATTFSPEADISRTQVVTMVVRAVEKVRPGALRTPAQDFVSSWADDLESPHAEAARLAEANGLLAGIAVTEVDPWGAMPRGEVAQILFNLEVLLQR